MPNFDPDVVESYDDVPVTGNDGVVRRMNSGDVQWMLRNLSPRSSHPMIAQQWRNFEATYEGALVVYETLLWYQVRVRERLTSMGRATEEEESLFRRTGSYLARLETTTGHMRRVATRRRIEEEQAAAQARRAEKAQKHAVNQAPKRTPEEKQRAQYEKIRARYREGGEALNAKDLQFSSLFGRLNEAVAAHRQASIDADIEPEPHDEELWSYADDLARALGFTSHGS